MGRLTASWLAFPGGEILLCRRRQEVWSRTQCGARRTIGVSLSSHGAYVSAFGDVFVRLNG